MSLPEQEWLETLQNQLIDMKRENYIQGGFRSNERIYLDNDWYQHGLPGNIQMHESVYVDTSYGFAAFHSKQAPGMQIGEGSGCYDRSSFIVSKQGQVTVGKFTILIGTSIVCNEQITIGDNCMLAWGSVITDTWLHNTSKSSRNQTLKNIGDDEQRPFPFSGESNPVKIEDNCWVGFGSVIMPGVTLGRGCIIGCKTVITKNVPAYAIVAGSAERIIRFLPPDDTEQAKAAALKYCLL